MKNRIIVLLAIIALISGSLFYIVPSVADKDTFEYDGEVKKEEVVYAKLSSAGSAESIYVVNIFDVNAPKKIHEFGDYTEVENLTNEDEITLSGDKVTIDAKTDDRLYYQGDMKKNVLPWKMNFEYYLDDVRMQPVDILGKSGKFKLKMHTAENTDLNSDFYDNYMLQITVPLDAEKFTDINPADGNIANAGSNKQITYLLLPGRDASVELKADVSDFELQGIQIAAVPLSMAIEMPIEELDDLESAISQLNDGVAELEKGMGELSASSDKVSDGSERFAQGLNKVDTLSSSILNSLSITLGEISTQVDNLSAEFTVANNQLSNAMGAVPDYDISESEINELYADNPGNIALNKLVLAYGSVIDIKAAYDSVQPAFDTVQANLPTIKTSIDAVNKSISSIPELNQGLDAYLGGVSKLNAGINALEGGTITLHDGTEFLVSELSTQREELLSAYDSSDFKPVSFASSNNKEVESVQFIMQTDPVVAKDAKKKSEDQEKELNFWERIKNLF